MPNMWILKSNLFMQDIFYVSEMPDITECEGNDLT